MCHRWVVFQLNKFIHMYCTHTYVHNHPYILYTLYIYICINENSIFHVISLCRKISVISVPIGISSFTFTPLLFPVALYIPIQPGDTIETLKISPLVALYYLWLACPFHRCKRASYIRATHICFIYLCIHILLVMCTQLQNWRKRYRSNEKNSLTICIHTTIYTYMYIYL